MTDEEMRAKVKKLVNDWVRQHDLRSYVAPTVTNGEISDLESRILALLKEVVSPPPPQS